MKKLTIILFLLPNLFFAKKLATNENLKVILVKNTKTLLFDSSTGSSDFSIKMFQLVGHSKKRVNIRFNKKSKTLDLSQLLTGTYVISTFSNKQYIDHLVSVFQDRVNIVDEKIIKKPIFSSKGKKFAISLLEDQSKVLVTFKTLKGETIFSEYFSSKVLNNKVFNLKNRNGKIKTIIEFDDKIFETKIII